MAKRDQGIDAHGAARGEVRGGEGDDEQKQREACEKKQIDAHYAGRQS